MKKTLSTLVFSLASAAIVLTGGSATAETFERSGGHPTNGIPTIPWQTARPGTRSVQTPTRGLAHDGLSRVNDVPPFMRIHNGTEENRFDAPPVLTNAYACINYSDAWSQTSAFPYALVSLSTINQSVNTIAPGHQFGTYMAVYTPDAYFTAIPTKIMGITFGMTYYLTDPNTFEVIGTYSGAPNITPSAMVYDQSTGQVYAFYDNGSTWIFGTLDMYSLTFNEIVNYDDPTFAEWVTLIVDNNNDLYAIDLNGDLLKVDKFSGEYDVVGNTGLKPKYCCTGAYEPKSGKTYFVMSNDSGTSMNEIDLATGASKQLFYYSDNQIFAGMFFYPEDPADGAPCDPIDLKTVFENGSLTGSLQFTVSETTVGGGAGAGNLSYEVLVDGVSQSEGSASYGGTVEVPLTLASAGYHTLGVILSNDKGKSAIQTTRAFFGEDTPTAVSGVTSSYNGSEFNVSWSAPTAAHNGYIDTDKIRYKVTRMPDNVVVAENTASTSITDPVTIPADAINYYYTVTVLYDNAECESATSNSIQIGAVMPPFTDSFDSAEKWDLYTVENIDNDAGKWGYSEKNGCIYIECSYSGKSFNDWVFTPSVKVEAGKNYIFSFNAKCNGEKYPEEISAYVGSEAKSSAMTTEIIPTTTIGSTSFVPVTGVYHAETTGIVYFGLHATTSNSTAWKLFVDDLSISAGIELNAPAAPANVTATPDPTGLTQATLKFNAPSIDVKGNQLESIDKITVKRNNALIATLDATPGQAVEYVDKNEDGGIVTGINTYVVTAENGAGAGTPATVSCFIGFEEPAQVTGVNVTPGSDYNKIDISWNPVTADVNGHPIPAARIEYIVTRVAGNRKEVVYRGSDLSYTDQACEPGSKQTFVYYGVQAVTSDNIDTEQGEYGTSALLPVGTPDSSPWIESFADAYPGHAMGTSSDDSAQWLLVDDNTVQNLKSIDTDGGMAVMTSDADNPTGKFATLMTGRISIQSLDRPYLTFYYYGYESENTIDVVIDDGTGVKTLQTVNISDTEKWGRKAIDLSAYKGKDIRIGFRGTIKDNPVIAIDLISIDNINDNDLRAIDITAPQRVNPDEDFNLSISYRNYGLNKAKGYNVSVYINDELVNTMAGPELEPGAGVKASLTANLSIIGKAENKIHYTLDWPDDEVPGNNRSEYTDVTVRIPSYPVVTDLRGEADETSASLEWSDPDLSQTPYSTTDEDVESYPAFSIGLPDSDVADDNIGDWQMYDADGLMTYTISGDYYFTNQGRPLSFIVFDSGALGLGERLAPHSGKQMFVAMASIGGESDDWLISPELSGDAQEISFWAWNADRYYGPENVEVLYSTTGTAPEDFISVAHFSDIPGTWTEYACKLPQGAKYFALRRTCYNTFIFCLDDIRFVAADAERMPLSIVGYNVYRNGSLAVNEPLISNEFTDNQITDGDNEYVVSVVYDRGESGASNKVTLKKTTGIDSVNGALRVYGEGTTIVVNGAAGKHLDIINPAGLSIYSADNRNDVRVNVSSRGIYLVKIGDRVCKVVI